MELQNGRWMQSGLCLTDIANQYGTPVYVYDAQTITDQVVKLQNAFGLMPLKLKYAAKALTNLSVLKLLKSLGVGLDAVSIEEILLAIRAGFEADEILFTPNNVGFQEIIKAVELGVQINIDNISMLEHFGHKYGSSVPCCIRLNPHIAAGGNAKIQTGHIDSKFGISILQMRHLLKVVRNNNMHINGLHIHTGSDFLNSDVFLQGADLVFEAATEFPKLDFIDFGSGFKVAYKANDVVTDIDELGPRMAEAYEQFAASYGSRPEIWFEPGKYLVSEAGVLLTRVNVLKTTPATVFVGVDTGLNHLIRPMMYDAYHEISNLSNPEGLPRIYTVAGYICETDTLGADRRLNEVREGDILALSNAGAYGFSMSSNYNSRLRPAEVLLVENKSFLIRRRETLEDLLITQQGLQEINF